MLFAKVIGIGHGRAEENLIRIPPPDIHHLGGLNTLIEEADPAVNSSQTLLAVLVIAVLGPVAVHAAQETMLTTFGRSVRTRFSRSSSILR